MSDTVIRVENLSKKYTIGHQQQERYPALRDVLANGAKGLLKSLRGGKSAGADPTQEEFWALKDVSFEIKAISGKDHTRRKCPLLRWRSLAFGIRQTLRERLRSGHIF